MVMMAMMMMMTMMMMMMMMVMMMIDGDDDDEEEEEEEEDEDEDENEDDDNDDKKVPHSEIRCIALCVFANFEGILGFSVPSIILADLLGNFVYLHEFKRSWFEIRDWWISISFVCFAFQGLLLCDRPVSGNYRLVKFAMQIFLIFLILVTCKNKATSASFIRQKIHSASRFPLLFLPV